MANDTRSSFKVRGEENSGSKWRQTSSDRMIALGLSTMDSSGLRRSARETALKKQTIPIPSSTRKSERFEKRSPTTRPAKRRSERIEKQLMPSPLRRSERGNKFHSVNSSGSKKPSNLSDMKRKKEKRETCVKRLSLEAGVLSRNKIQGSKSVPFRNARDYRSSFRPQKVNMADICQGVKGPDRASKCGVFVSEIDKCNKRRRVSCERPLEESNYSSGKSTNETVGNLGKVGQSSSSQNCRHTLECMESQGEEDFLVPKGGNGHLISPHGLLINETSDDAEGLQAPILIDSTSKEKSLNGAAVEGGGHQSPSSKRKSIDAGLNFDACATVGGSKDIADGVSSLPSSIKKNNYVETSAYNKRERLHSDSSKLEFYCSPVELDQQLCQSSPSMDRGALGASTGFADKCDSNIQQNMPSSDMQMNADHNTCFICKMGGKLLCCDGKGCKKSSHASCLDSPLDEVPIGAWFCFWCVSKKIELGVHYVSGVESIWDAREVELPNVEGLRREKQYLVKYKGLAHVHCNWVPESQLLLEAPVLLSKFKRKNQVIRWNKEYTVPQRLLQKRLLTFPKDLVGSEGIHAGKNKICQYEWLVKWCGLDYEHVTWELESTTFLVSPVVQRLMEEYENRHKNAKTASDPSRTDKEKKGSLFKLSKLPGLDSPQSDTTDLYVIDKLRDYWHRCHNCVVFDDQDRIMKIVLFILSLQSNVCHPFLIISTTAALMSWETKFLNLASSVNTIVYSGSKKVREVIRKVEFYGDGGGVMFQVLLSSPEAIIEDLEAIKTLRWEACIVDECLRSRMSTYFEQFKLLVTDMRLLLISGQMKDSVAENLSFLSFLGQDGDDNLCNGAKTDSSENIGNVRERLSRFIAYESKTESSKLVEYWVPVPLSNVQLEQYCSVLLSNGIALRSSSKNDEVGALRDILISIRKCCNHPYTADPNLQQKLLNGLSGSEIINVDIKASGKLQFLDNVLSEIKNQGLRALILFQSIGGSVKDIIGDILEDLICHRFDKDSYERLDGGGVIPSTRQATLNKFNNKESGRFVFLLENRACLRCIKFSSVDIIIIFNSELNPVIDLRALQKIKIDSQNEHIKVFRLYHPCTVEEKVLILSKQDASPDSNMQSISRIASHMLLMWGASFLFKKLDEFHASNSSSFGVSLSSVLSNFNDSVQELLTLVSQNSDSLNTIKSSILKVRQSGIAYCNNISLPGELEILLTDEKQPHVFWAQLLEGRCHQWNYSSWPSQRNRKRVQYTEEFPKQSEFGNDSVAKKRKKADKGKLLSTNAEWTAELADNGSQSLLKSTACVDHTVNTNHASTSPLVTDDILEVADIHMVDSEEKGNLQDAQKSLHLLLKPELSKLCEVLKFSDDIKGMVGRFFEYTMNNHVVNREPVSILQAFQISLCWAAASKLRHKIDREKSIELARQHLNFSCQKEEVKSIYSMLGFLKNLLSPAEHVRESNILNDLKSAAIDFSDNLHVGLSQSTAGEELQQEQLEEVRKFEKACAEKEEEQKNRYRVELGFIRSLYSHIPLGTDRERIQEKKFAEEMEMHKSKMVIDRKNLEAKQLAARNELKQKEARRLQKMKSAIQIGSLGNSPLHECGHMVENLSSSEKVSAHNCVGSAVPMSGKLSEEQSPYHIVDNLPIIDVAPSENDASVPNEAVASGIQSRTNTIGMMNNDKSDQLSNSASSDSAVKLHDSIGNCNSYKVGLVNLPSEERIPDGAMADTAVGAVLQEASVNAADEVVESNQFRERSTLVTDSNKENDVALDGPIVIDSGQLVGSCSSNGDTLINLPSSEALISNGAIADRAVMAVPPEEPENAADEIVEGNQLIERSTLVTESNRINDMASDRPIVVDSDQHDGGGPINGDSLRSKPCQINDSEHSITLPQWGTPPPTWASSGSPSFGQALPNECSQLPSSTEIQDDVTTRREQNMLSNHFNHDAAIEDSVLQLQLQQSPDLHFCQNQPDLPLADGVEHQLLGDGQTSCLNTRIPVQLVENPVEILDTSVSHSLENSSRHPPIVTEFRSGDEDLSSCQTAQALTPLVGNQAEPSNQAASESVTQSPDNSAAVFAEFSNHHAQISPPVVAPIPPAASPDPLQNELERIRKEMERANKTLEDTKLQLRSDCDKEIEEIVTQIRIKYETKVHDVEATFKLKKEELDTNHNKVLMNKKLAEAFRSKCMDLRASGTPRMLQGASSFMQQLFQLSQQSVPRTSFAAASPSSASLPAVILQAATLTPTLPVQAATLTPTLPVQAATLTPTLPVQAVHNSSAFFSNAPPRPPQIGSLTPSTGNYQVATEIRAPAPHLQPFRPSSSPPASGLPLLSRGMTSQPICNNSISSSLPHVPSRPAQPPPPLIPPMYHPAACNRVHQPESARELGGLRNSSISTMDLLMEVDNRPNADAPIMSPPLLDLDANFDPFDLSQFGIPGSLTVNPTHERGAGSELVCLSDDD